MVRLRVFLRVIHRVEQHLAVEHIDVHVITAAAEERVHHADEVRDLIFGACGPSPCGTMRRRERNAVRRVAIRNLRDGRGRGHDAVRVPAVHRIGAGRERLALAAAIRRVAGVLAVNDVRRDGQHRLRVDARCDRSDASAACS